MDPNPIPNSTRVPIPVATLVPDTPTQPGNRSTARLGERAQSTVEYALILLGAAAVALAVVAWATSSGVVGSLFDAVLGDILSKVT